MKSWKKQLIKEFDAAAPALKDEVLNAPIVTERDEATDMRNGNVLVKRKIGLFASCGAAAVLIIVLAFLGIFGVFGQKNGVDGFVFSLEINPAVAFVTDKDGKVKSVNALNEDADVILSDETTLGKLKNVPLSEAVVTYTDCAARLGYLDLSADKNAVRLSSSTETDKALLESASDGLRGYFKTNGIFAVVVEDTVAVDELSERLGVKITSDLSELTDSLEKLSVRFGERIGENASVEKLQSFYETYIIGSQTLGYVRDELLGNVEKIVSNAQMLSQMEICSYNIMMHGDNPFNPLPADYWTVKKYPNAEYGAEFAALMDEMSGLLAEYENEFGVSIESISDLTAAADAYSSLSDIDFEELFSSLTVNDFKTSADKYVGMLKNIGCDVADLETLLSAPQTAQEYFAQLQTTLNRLYNSRTEMYKDIYGQERAEISETEYNGFVNGVIKEYGSLENFWNKK